jgi:UDP-sulfoquinovose synthase
MVSSELETRFTYDHVFGTVLNRFLTQAIAGIPLTVYGKGGQTRGYLNLIDTIKCVELAALNPAEQGDFRVMNQFTEQFTVNQLVKMVRAAANHLNIQVKVDHIENPRNEAEEHYYEAEHSKLPDLGLEPTLLSIDRLVKMLEFVQKYKANIDINQIQPKVKWDANHRT